MDQKPPFLLRSSAGAIGDFCYDLPVAPNLLGRNFTVDRPDQVWLADISHISTGEGWRYVAAIEDMATRQIVGWSMGRWCTNTVWVESPPWLRILFDTNGDRHAEAGHPV